MSLHETLGINNERAEEINTMICDLFFVRNLGDIGKDLEELCNQLESKREVAFASYVYGAFLSKKTLKHECQQIKPTKMLHETLNISEERKEIIFEVVGKFFLGVTGGDTAEDLKVIISKMENQNEIAFASYYYGCFLAQLTNDGSIKFNKEKR